MASNPDRIQPSLEAFWYAERHTDDPRLKRIGLRGLFIQSLFGLSDSLGMSENDKDLAVMAALQVVELVRPSIIELCRANKATLDWTDAEWTALAFRLADALRKDWQVQRMCEGVIEDEVSAAFDRKPGKGPLMPKPKGHIGLLGLLNYGIDYIEYMKGTDEYVHLFFDARLLSCKRRVLYALYTL